MNSIIRCYTARDIHNLHPEWYKCEVDRLWITELDQDEIECSELNCWICDVDMAEILSSGYNSFFLSF